MEVVAVVVVVGFSRLAAAVVAVVGLGESKPKYENN